MKILVTGGTGFIGKKLCPFLLQKNHQLLILSRNANKVPALFGKNIQGINNIDQLTATDHFDAIINLAGAGIIDKRWTTQRKQELLHSRVHITEQLIQFISRANQKPAVFLSGSATGFYGNRGNKILNEQNRGQEDFAHLLCEQWEETALQAENYAVRTCIIRTGLVLAADGGFLKRMLLPFKLGLGGRIADGSQWMPWIHYTDYLAITNKLLESNTLQGIFNATAPHPVTNAEFTRILSQQLHRPAIIPLPAWLLKITLGEMAELLTGGQRAMPARLEKAGFVFKFNTLESALKNVLIEADTFTSSE